MFRLGSSGGMQFSMIQIHYYEWKRCKDDVGCEQEHLEGFQGKFVAKLRKSWQAEGLTS